MRWILPICLGAVLALTGCSEPETEEVNVYSARKEALIKPLLDRFTEQTGVKVNLITADADALIARMQAEGEYSPADLLLTVDAGRLYRAEQAGLLAPVRSQTLDDTVPSQYQDPEGRWYGLSVRSRVMVYAPERVEADQLNTYADLADERWRGRVCIRSSSNIYNQSLVASMIAHQGQQATQTWAEGLVANMARSPKGGDRDQIMAVANGVCDVAVVNTYYLGQMLNSDEAEQKAAAESVAVRWPNQDGRGAHVNISGAGVVTTAPNPEQAKALLEFLVTDASQRWYAETNHEYPVKEGVAISDTLKQWGEFKADQLPLVKLGELNAEAVRLMDRAGWQ
jgi:iron(III) transport system substrate-binding protein